MTFIEEILSEYIQEKNKLEFENKINKKQMKQFKKLYDEAKERYEYNNMRIDTLQRIIDKNSLLK